jgi:hypothetical protein
MQSPSKRCFALNVSHNPIMKRKAHVLDPKDIELNQWEFQLVMGEAWENRNIFIENIFCECESPKKQLIDFKVYLNDINDIILKGKCSECKTIAARYIETGENINSIEAAERIRKMKMDSD